jgi:hypothetical protein
MLIAEDMEDGLLFMGTHAITLCPVIWTIYWFIVLFDIVAYR